MKKFEILGLSECVTRHSFNKDNQYEKGYE